MGFLKLSRLLPWQKAHCDAVMNGVMLIAGGTTTTAPEVAAWPVPDKPSNIKIAREVRIMAWRGRSRISGYLIIE
jgi:hypothetical protein